MSSSENLEMTDDRVEPTEKARHLMAVEMLSHGSHLYREETDDDARQRVVSNLTAKADLHRQIAAAMTRGENGRVSVKETVAALDRTGEESPVDSAYEADSDPLNESPDEKAIGDWMMLRLLLEEFDLEDQKVELEDTYVPVEDEEELYRKRYCERYTRLRKLVEMLVNENLDQSRDGE